MFADLPGQGPDAQSIWAGDIKNGGWTRGEGQTLQCPRIGVPLPDEVHLTHAQIDGLPSQDPSCQVYQHTIAQIVGIVEPEDGDPGAVAIRGVFEEPLPCDTAHRVLADWSHRMVLG